MRSVESWLCSLLRMASHTPKSRCIPNHCVHSQVLSMDSRRCSGTADKERMEEGRREAGRGPVHKKEEPSSLFSSHPSLGSLPAGGGGGFPGTRGGGSPRALMMPCVTWFFVMSTRRERRGLSEPQAAHSASLWSERPPHPR